MNHARCRTALFALALLSSALLLACGGKSSDTLDGLSGDGACLPAPCPLGLGGDPVTCTCDLSTDAAPPVEVDASSECQVLRCPAGSVAASQSGQCFCLLVDSGAPVDAMAIHDAMPPDVSQPNSPDASYEDVSSPEASSFDVFAPPPDSSVPTDGPYFDSCPPNYCGVGYAPSPSEFCECVLCPNPCPAGQTPGISCSSCVACPYVCPVGFDPGPNCGCVPRGTEAGTVPPVDAGDGGDSGPGVTCVIEGYTRCSAGWCELGLCPDDRTQYGCYCKADGTAACDLSCPVPPPCTIPGEGTCPYGSQCVFGSCENQSDSVFVCSCSSGGSAYCDTASCADGGPPVVGDGGNPGYSGGGVTCLLGGGYASCNAGSFCALGTCPDGTTQYGCFCNQDGSSTCNLTCPQPPPCEIPGEGTCPYGSQCVFGSCSGDGGTQLSCYCGYGGQVSCYTFPCADAGLVATIDGG